MYNALRKEVEPLCDSVVMDAIIDQFGPDVKEQYRQTVENAAKFL